MSDPIYPNNYQYGDTDDPIHYMNDEEDTTKEGCHAIYSYDDLYANETLYITIEGDCDSCYKRSTLDCNGYIYHLNEGGICTTLPCNTNQDCGLHMKCDITDDNSCLGTCILSTNGIVVVILCTALVLMCCCGILIKLIVDRHYRKRSERNSDGVATAAAVQIPPSHQFYSRYGPRQPTPVRASAAYAPATITDIEMVEAPETCPQFIPFERDSIVLAEAVPAGDAGKDKTNDDSEI